MERKNLNYGPVPFKIEKALDKWALHTLASTSLALSHARQPLSFQALSPVALS